MADLPKIPNQIEGLRPETNQERKIRKAKEKSERHERRRSVNFRKKNLVLICLKLFAQKIPKMNEIIF